MSWGERSCRHRGNCPIPNECSMYTCNVNCREYLWDGLTKPDSQRTIEAAEIQKPIPKLEKPKFQSRNQKKAWRRRNRK